MTCIQEDFVVRRPVSLLGVALSAEDWASIRQSPILGDALAFSAGSCSELSGRIAEHPPDIVISCSELPDGTWKNALAACQRLSVPPPVIVASRLADEHLWAEVLNLGGFDLIARPLDARELGWIVRSALRLRDAAWRTACT